eukprot:TRINITY_DN10733_c0_g1_i1.p1 TRINITY_DN10733_c0_g1~~TRINITY_DN10733_c0_g1_i1.p1  ORF type:complete len:562 (+),score=73.93 TRINITY_DN10733_c0_g1_i1:95-1780(+)
MARHIVMVGNTYGESSPTMSQLLSGSARFWEDQALGVNGGLSILGDETGKPASKQAVISAIREVCQGMSSNDQAAIALIGRGDDDGTYLTSDYKTSGGISGFELRNCLSSVPPTCRLVIICDYQYGGSILDLPFKLTAEKDPVNSHMQLRLDATSLPRTLPTRDLFVVSTVPQHGGNSRTPLGGFMSAIVAALNINSQPAMQQLLADVWHILSTSNATGATDFVCMPRISSGSEFTAADPFTLFTKRVVAQQQPVVTPELVPSLRVELHPSLIVIQGSWITSTGTEVTISGSSAIFIASGHRYPLSVDTRGIVSLMGSNMLGNPAGPVTRLVWDDGDVWAKHGFAIPVMQNSHSTPLVHTTPPRAFEINRAPQFQQPRTSKYDTYKMGINLLLNRAVRDTLRRTFEKFTLFVLMCRQFRRITNIGIALEKASLNLIAAKHLHKWRLFYVLKRPTQLPYKFRPVKGSRVGTPDRIAIWVYKGIQSKQQDGSTTALYESLRSVRGDDCWNQVIDEYNSQFSEELEELMFRILEPFELEQCAAILLSNGVSMGTHDSTPAAGSE